MRFEDRFVQTVHPAARLARDGYQRRAAQLGQQAFEHLFQFGQLFLLFVFQIPFVDRNHNRAPFGFGKVANPQVLGFKRNFNV